MRIHMDLDFHEPPDGDFVRLIEALVGAPPEDPEMTAKQISAQLAARSKHNQQMTDTSPGDDVAAARAAAAPIGGPPDIADALESIARSGAGTIRRAVGGIASLMIFVGIAVVVAAIVLADQFPGFSVAPGVGLLFAGIVLRNVTS